MATRIDDGVPLLGSGIGAAALLCDEHVLLGSFVFLAGSVLSLVLWDVRRAGGLAAWAEGLLRPADRWHKLADRRKRRRDARRTAHLRERETRRHIRRRSRQSRGDDA
jgi:hypothetical protein